MGPISLRELGATLSRESGAENLLVWREGFAAWQKAASVPELASFLSAGALPQPPSIPCDASAVGLAETQTTPGWAKRVIGYGASIAGLVIGISLSQWLGGVFWLPALLTVAAFAVLSRTRIKPALIPSVSFSIGHCLWFTSGLVLLAALGMFNAVFWNVAVELPIFTAIVAWVVAAQSRSALIVLMVYDTLALALNVVTAVENPAAAVFVHVAMRLLVVIAAAYALIRWPRVQVLNNN